MTVLGHARLFPAAAPADVFFRLAQRAGVFWLDSSLTRPDDGRYSIMGCEPRWVFVAAGQAWRIERDGRPIEQGTVGSLAKIEELLAAHRVVPSSSPDLPFWGGAVGWFSYDLGRQFESVEESASADVFTPDIRLAWHDAAIIWDHRAAQTWLVGADGERPAEVAMRELAAWSEAPSPEVEIARTPQKCGLATSDLQRESYLAKVQEIRASIARGEVYQANLTQRFACTFCDEPSAIYLRLRELNPAPFALYQAAGGTVVLSSSPERFLEVSPHGHIRTCPIKGTRPRGRTPEEDQVQREELMTSAKERAELLMIVDLLRNDLGRVCEFGSIKVPRLHSLESFATVHHLVGEVTGQLRPEVGLGGLLRAVFPGGSITGAPKVAALRLIERLEPHRRGIGMGALGYVSAHGRIDLNVAIRTIICRDGRAYFHLGAGIVWDSDPAAEYEETLVKGRALFEALGVEADRS